jgi:hypothetical protein
MIAPLEDRGQELPVPERQVIGFVDTPAQLEQLTRALRQAGYPESSIVELSGEGGLHLLHRLRGVSFFGDWERAVVDEGITELEKGHISIAVSVDSLDEATRVANLATPLGGHGFNYFGPWINEQLTK